MPGAEDAAGAAGSAEARTARTPRIHGLDIARAVAIIGMMGAHFGPWSGRPALAAPSTWPAVVNGYPSALFAVLAGVSIGIIARRGVAAGGVELLRSRMRLGARAVILIALGLVLASVQSDVMVVLVPMGAMFLVTLPLVSARTRTVAVVAAVLGVAGPLMMAPARVFPQLVTNPTVGDAIVFTYPLTAWAFYGLVGLLVHRLVLKSPPRWPWLAAGGAVLALAAAFTWSALVPAFGVGTGEGGGADIDVAWDDGMGGVNWAADVSGAEAVPELEAGADGGPVGGPDTGLDTELDAGITDGQRLLGAFVDGSAHSAGLLDVAGAATASIALIAALLMVGRTRFGAAALHPLRMMGSMSLTVYVAHVASFAVLGVAGRFVPAIAQVPGEIWLVVSIIAAVLFAVAWKRRHRRGPLEEAMHRATERAARIDVRGEGRGGGPS
ncbi:DUF418 domain-containing protein [Corynebacterium sp. NPDC060344]|uniref:DUF418 domain-containing protein n=1 Tax=Corynebacterium sp. NPDC060344 TaxID=3347101 RepID=UPI003661DAC4